MLIKEPFYLYGDMEINIDPDNDVFSFTLLLISYLSICKCVFGAQKKRLIETVLLSTQNMFCLGNMKYNYSLRSLILRPGRIYVSCKSNIVLRVIIK